jgi:hypothetical protein
LQQLFAAFSECWLKNDFGNQTDSAGPISDAQKPLVLAIISLLNTIQGFDLIYKPEFVLFDAKRLQPIWYRQELN